MENLSDISPDLIGKIQRLALFYRNNPVYGFVPSPALEDFMDDDSSRILVRAANRIGKTVTATVKLTKIMLKYPNRRYRVVGVDYGQAIGVISKLLWDFIPHSELVDGCTYTTTNGWIHQLIRIKNGTTCEIRSNDQKAIAHAGSSLHGIWCDEPPKPEIYLESVTRVMDTKGFLWITATPIGRPCGWLKDVVNNPESIWKEHVVEFNHRNCPWYTKEQVDAWILEAQSAPWAYRQKIFGDWEGETVDRTFTGFIADCQIKEDDDLPEEDYFIGIGIDHGESVGKQVALICIWTTTDFIVLDEVVSTSSTTPEMDASAIIACLKTWGWDITDVNSFVGDVNSAGKANAGHKVNELLGDALCSQAGYKRKVITINPPNKGSGSVSFGEKLLNSAFMRGQLKVSTRCKTLTNALKHYNGQESLKHSIDALRYISYDILNGWSVIMPVAGRIRVNKGMR